MSEKSKTPWQKTFDPNYMGSWSLQDGEELTTVITDAKEEQITNPKGETKGRVIIYLKDAPKNGLNLPMVIGNKTNARILEKLAGSCYIEDWPGTRITIFVQRGVKAFGSTVDALRIREKANAKQRLTQQRFSKMIEAIEAQQYDKIAALENFELTEDQKKIIAAL